jgi:hypothetical protein
MQARATWVRLSRRRFAAGYRFDAEFGCLSVEILGIVVAGTAVLTPSIQRRFWETVDMNQTDSRQRQLNQFVATRLRY